MIMKRILFILTAAMLTVSAAHAESLPGTVDTQDGDVVFSAESIPTQTPLAQLTDEGDLQLDFSSLTLDNPLSSPVPVDPIDKPTPTPMPEPSYTYENYTNEQMGVSFSIPYTWLLNPNTNLETTVQFVEPKSEMMEPDGYQTRITIEKVNMGLSQTSADAYSRLESTLTELENSFTSFTPNNIASASMGNANGSYCYYRAEYNDGTKDYSMRGRIIIVAQGNALYQVRITTPRAWYSYYEEVFRKVRSSFKFL